MSTDVETRTTWTRYPLRWRYVLAFGLAPFSGAVANAIHDRDDSLVVVAGLLSGVVGFLWVAWFLRRSGPLLLSEQGVAVRRLFTCLTAGWDEIADVCRVGRGPVSHDRFELNSATVSPTRTDATAPPRPAKRRELRIDPGYYFRDWRNGPLGEALRRYRPDLID